MNSKMLIKINKITTYTVFLFLIFSFSVLAQESDRRDIQIDRSDPILMDREVEANKENRAVDTVSSERRILSDNERLNDVRDVVIERIRQVEERIGGSSEERRVMAEERFNEQRQNAAKIFADNIIRRLNSLVERLENMSLTISQRVERLENIGFNLDTAKNLIEDVNNDIEKLKEEILAAEILIEESFHSANPRESMFIAREIMFEARNSVRKIHRDLVLIISEIRMSVDSIRDRQSVDNSNEIEHNNEEGETDES